MGIAFLSAFISLLVLQLVPSEADRRQPGDMLAVLVDNVSSERYCGTQTCVGEEEEDHISGWLALN